MRASILSCSSSNGPSTDEDPESSVASSQSSPSLVLDGRVRHVEAHPTLPWVAAVVLPNDSSGSTSSSSPSSSGGGGGGDNVAGGVDGIIGGGDSSSGGGAGAGGVGDGRVVVWDYLNNEVLRTVTHSELSEWTVGGGSRGDGRKQQGGGGGCRRGGSAREKIGSIRSARFVDRNALHWNSGYVPSTTASSSSSPRPPPPGAVGTSPPSGRRIPPPMLLVRCDRRVVSLHLRRFTGGGGGHGDNPVVCTVGPEDLETGGQAASSPSPPTCHPTAAEPLTPDVVLIGCSDGSVRAYSVAAGRVVRSLKAHHRKTKGGGGGTGGGGVCSVAKILSAPPSRHRRADDSEGGEGEDGGGGAASSSGGTGDDDVGRTTTDRGGGGGTTTNSRHRVVTVATDGSAYVWDFSCSFVERGGGGGGATGGGRGIGGGGGDGVVRVRRPIAKMERILVPVGAGDGVGGGGGDVDDLGRVLHYDPEREFFVAGLAATDGWGSSGGLVGLWDLSTPSASPPTTSASSGSSAVPSIAPFLVVRVPPPFHPTSSLVVPANHPSYSDTTLTLLAASNAGSGAGGGGGGGGGGVGGGAGEVGAGAEVALLATSLLSSAGGEEGKALVPENHLQFALGRGGEEAKLGSKLRIYSMAVPRFRNRMVVCGTNFGITVVELEDEIQCKSGSRHASVGVSGGVLLVEGSSVFAATLDAPQPNPVGPMRVKNPVLVYKSIVAPEHVLEHHAIRQPPRLLVSPSRAFVCMFWTTELRYEILHIDSLLGPKLSGVAFPPPVEIGTGVSSFAWVGTEDEFAILRLESKDDDSLSAAPAKQGRFDFVKQRKGKSSTPTTDGSADTTYRPEHASRGGDIVEMRKLFPVAAEAARVSDSLAAATATSLGVLTARGGQPSSLHGGPVLCIACSRQGGDVDITEDGLSYFYAKKSDSPQGALEATAASYVAVGPSLPYPDLVEWNDDATLCCVCVGSRIAIYASHPPEFKLVGTSLLSPGEACPKVESARFLNGVLLCSSSTCVQCIFLGDHSEGRTSLFFVDSFVLATSDVPVATRAIRNNASVSVLSSLTPVPVTLSLSSPSVLTFFAGSLVVSTSSGLQAITLDQPLLRIGILLGAGHTVRAQRWFEAVDTHNHEALARFLERRGVPAMAAELPGISIDTVVDLSFKWKLTKTLENLIDTHGLSSIRNIDMGGDRGGYGAVECVGTFLLGEGKAELVRRLASECVVSGDEARREAFVLASLLLAVDPSDARRLVKRAIGTKVKISETAWPVGNYIQEHTL